MNRRRIIYTAASLLLLFLLLWLISPGGSSSDSNLIVSPVRGEFLVTVTTTGELKAKNSIKIMGPTNARAANVWNMKISNLVPEGTVVKKGDFVAELDKSEITGKLKESQLSIQKLEAQYEQTQLDSALALSQARDELVNLKYAEEEKRIIMEQSVYEAPAMQRQAKIDFERAQRNTEQAKKNYVTKTQQSIAKMKVVDADLMKERQRLDLYSKTVEEFTINAPADGMVVYAREWGGRKKVVGTTIGAWDPLVATLPDLREMESVTYVTEIDIQKVEAGQSVKIKLDADPGKILTGSVVSVGNIGEQRPNSDAKVFELTININESDTTLRPAMTTSNEILVAKLDDVLRIPLDCIHTEGEMTFVYLKDGGGVVKKEVKLGLLNENEAVIVDGIQESDEVYLSLPAEEVQQQAVITIPSG